MCTALYLTMAMNLFVMVVQLEYQTHPKPHYSLKQWSNGWLSIPNKLYVNLQTLFEWLTYVPDTPDNTHSSHSIIAILIHSPHTMHDSVHCQQ